MNLLCAAVLFIGFTGPLTTQDKADIVQATITCPKLFPNNPCLFKFIKKEEGVYNVICGPQKERKSDSKFIPKYANGGMCEYANGI